MAAERIFALGENRRAVFTRRNFRDKYGRTAYALRVIDTEPGMFEGAANSVGATIVAVVVKHPLPDAPGVRGKYWVTPWLTNDEPTYFDNLTEARRFAVSLVPADEPMGYTARRAAGLR